MPCGCCETPRLRAMKKPHSSKRQSKTGRSATPAIAPRREKWIVAASFAALMVILALSCIVFGVFSRRAVLNKQMMKWKAAYHLTDEQAARIHQIEVDFHGNGNPFTSPASGTPEENDAHHLEISREMNPEDGARFIEVMNKKGGGH